MGIIFFIVFSYFEGVKGAFEAYAVWTKTGGKEHTQSGMWAYLKWGMAIEGPILILSALGTVIAFIKVRHRFALFAGLWAFGLFAAYTIIPYKTPWLALSFLLPMCIAAGYAINELASKDLSGKFIAGLLALVGTGVLAFQTYQLNFVRYDDQDLPYVYAHTTRQFLDLVADIERYADKSGKGRDTAISIVSPDYWPMVWYLNDYPKAVFHGAIPGADAADIIVAKESSRRKK